MDCNVKMNGVYYGVLRIEKMFDSHTFSNSSGSGYIYASCHKKGFNDDGSGKRRITWKMGG